MFSRTAKVRTRKSFHTSRSRLILQKGNKDLGLNPTKMMMMIDREGRKKNYNKKFLYQ